MEKWDKRFLRLAREVSTWSKDPSTKVGAVITRGNEVISLGFNGFPSGTLDEPWFYEDRNIKLRRIIHAETNAILYAKGNLKDTTLYTWPIPPCERCATLICQVGIKHVVTMWNKPEQWQYAMELAQEILGEKGITITYYDNNCL